MQPVRPTARWAVGGVPWTSGEVEVYALYDKNHTPHVTVEYGTGKSSVPEKQRSQILQLTGNGPLTVNESSQ
jgi:uncharacterized membrane protein YvbJ